jgi:hypothetical protein
MKAVGWLAEMVIAVSLFLDGMYRLVIPVPAPPVSVPWLAGLSSMAQWVMWATGSVEIVVGMGFLFPALLGLTDWSDQVHARHHGAHP